MSTIIWFRRDLRTHDNATLYQAMSYAPVVAVFIFDTNILNRLPADDARVSFIFHAVEHLSHTIRQLGGHLLTYHGDPIQIIPKLAEQLNASAVYAGEDYEPLAIARDLAVAEQLKQQNCALNLIKDQVIFARQEVLSQKKTPFTVFTPYKNAWLKCLQSEDMAVYDRPPHQAHWQTQLPDTVASRQPITLNTLGFTPQSLKQQPDTATAQAYLSDFLQRIHHYHTARDFPAIKGVSYLSVYLRFGLISIRQLVREAFFSPDEGAKVWLSELIWREFYMQFLWHHPFVTEQAYLPKWRHQTWTNRTDWFTAWCQGKTGYPFIDAGMRQLNQTGYMHNRLRMITAAFLVKHLDIDWRWGEAYFAQKLLDFDLSANNGGWQWAASTGCDAAQPFRIFNPITQSQKFDPEGKFIKRYLPELAELPTPYLHTPWLTPPLLLKQSSITLGIDYPLPLVDHAQARQQALAKYASL